MRATQEAEYDEFFASRAPQMRRTAYLILHDWHAAEDAVQNAFVQLYLAWPRIRPETIDGYARRTLVNAAISLTRKNRRERLTAEAPDRAAPPTVELPELTSALRELPASQRAIVALRFLEDLPVREVAEALGIAEGTVKSQTARALQTLRRVVPALSHEE